MTTVYQGSTVSEQLPVGKMLTVTAAAGGSAFVERIYAFQKLDEIIVDATASVLFGPFIVPMLVRISCTAGAAEAVVSDSTHAVDVTDSVAALNAAQTFTKSQVVAPVVLTPGATVTPDSSASNNFSLAPAQSFTLANATNPAAARALNIEIIQDAIGSRVMTLGSEYLFFSGADKVLSTPAGAIDYLSCVRNSANTAWLCSLAKSAA